MIKLILFFGLAAILLFPILLGLASASLWGIWRALTYETRFRRFFAKYDNEDVARMIASGRIWTGQTAGQLRDAKGAPLRIENMNGAEIWVYPGKTLTPLGHRIQIHDGRVRDWS